MHRNRSMRDIRAIVAKAFLAETPGASGKAEYEQALVQLKTLTHDNPASVAIAAAQIVAERAVVKGSAIDFSFWRDGRTYEREFQDETGYSGA